ncbi:MAG TPA: MBL fold metallo-hydrolase [Deinococcales bacterium]|nr:MBL fold metallo-hydrolase [Deinococcales bacterium]
MNVLSYGAARTVTGSNHLVQAGGTTLLLDCGLFQGSRALDDLNDLPFVYDLGAIDAAFLTHAHLDHSGRMPLLVKRGYQGPVYCTPATQELARYLLLDAAKLQQEDYERDLRKGRAGQPPLFDEDDVAAFLECVQPIEYGKPVTVGAFKVTAQVAGHVPGSASFVLDGPEGRVVFSGDLGNERKDILPDPVLCPPADVVLMESTYGDRDHRPFEATIEELAAAIRGAAERGGKIMIPTFALERTQDVLFHIARLEEAGRVPVLPVIVDSPLALKVEHVYDTWRNEFSEEVEAIYRRGKDPFAPAGLRYTRSVDDSKALNEMNGPAIILAGSGMMTGGRILHHLRNRLPSAANTLIIVGFQPAGGLGRLLVDGRDRVRIMGHDVAVRAQITTIGGLSAHADRTELLRWAASAGPKASVKLVHGEVAAMTSLKAALEAQGQRAELQPPSGPVPPDNGKPSDGE